MTLVEFAHRQAEVVEALARHLDRRLWISGTVEIDLDAICVTAIANNPNLTAVSPGEVITEFLEPGTFRKAQGL